jgi:hypothetical protein
MSEFNKIASDAYRTIKRKGWVQRSNRGPKGEYCLLQAIEDNCHVKGEFMDFYDFLLGKLGLRPDLWNDKKGRTKEEVLALLRSIS